MIRPRFRDLGPALVVALVFSQDSACMIGPEDDADLEPTALTVRDLSVVAPGSGLPAEAPIQDANNNLDLVRHEGRVFFAFRTAPTHFASSETRLHVVSSEDELTWRWEGTFAMDTDLREPRFLSWNGDLFLYFAVLGADSGAFEPQGMMVSRWLGPGGFAEAEWFYEDGFIPWRARVVDGIPYLISYIGGEEIYNGEEPEPIEVHWLTTDDGVEWSAAFGGDPVVERGGGSETDFAFQDDGSVVAVTRNEAGDELGWGSRICRGEAESPSLWTCVGDPRKYDSPLVFRHGEGTYLIGRRNVTEDGNYDLFQRGLSHADQTRAYQVEFWQHPKRCSLWQIDPDSLAVTFVLDLPSRGDTCFASEIADGPHDHIVYNYSSDVNGPDLTWLQGQVGPTYVYRQVLRLSEP